MLEDLALLRRWPAAPARLRTRSEAALLERYRAAGVRAAAQPPCRSASRSATPRRSWRATATTTPTSRTINDVRRSDPLAETEIVGRARAPRAAAGARARASTRARERQRVAFASFYLGRDTDPDAIARALDVAAHGTAARDRDADVDAVARAARRRCDADPQLTRAAEQLRGALEAARAQLARRRRAGGERARAGSETLAIARAGAPVSAEALATVHPLARRSPTRSPTRVADPLHAARAGRACARRRCAAATLARCSSANDARGAACSAQRFAGDDTAWDELAAPSSAYLRELEEQLVGAATDPRPGSDALRARRHRGAAARVRAGVGRCRPSSRPRSNATTRPSARVASAFDADRAGELVATRPRRPVRDRPGPWVELAEHVDDLRDYIELRRHRERAAQLGWGEFVEHLLTADVAADEMEAAFERAWWTRRLEAPGARERPSCSPTTARPTRAGSSEFRRLDRQLVDTGADRLIAARNGHRPALVDGVGSEVAILKARGRQDAAASARPQAAGADADAAVRAQAVPDDEPAHRQPLPQPAHRFDLVVFDEASQVPPWDAINCIYRGAQLIVAGDSKQLPPTAFFQRAELDDDGLRRGGRRHARRTWSSVLDACKVLLPEHALQVALPRRATSS